MSRRVQFLAVLALIVVASMSKGEHSDIAQRIQRGESFLINLFDASLQLLLEYKGSGTYWLFHDNYLAAHLLAQSRPELSRGIRSSLAKFGVTNSGKIEIVFDEAKEPLPFRTYVLTNVASVEGKSIRTELVTTNILAGWDNYADLLLLASLAQARTAPADARRNFDKAGAMWNGEGFQDLASRHSGLFATYKLALYLIAADRLKISAPNEVELLAHLLAMQTSDGGWITDYKEGNPVGVANVETTCFALLALKTLRETRESTAPNPAGDAGPTRIELTCVDPAATGYGTFQSHNQKVVSNRRGYFMTHIRTRNEAYTAQQWRLSWSRDGGRSFETLYEATDATNPPLLESDESDNVYLIRPDFSDGHAYLYRFMATNDYREPAISRIPNGAAGKYAMVLDQSRRQLCYFAHNNTFHLVGLDGRVRLSTNLLTAGKSAILQYPLLCLDSQNTLHAAWTSQKHGVYLYWDIHYLQSPDGGTNWRTMAGKSVTLPVVADEGGPADRITLDDEFEVHTWLSSFLVKGGKAHFLYLAQTNPPRQHYVRYDLKTAKRELDIQPEFKGQQLSLAGWTAFSLRTRRVLDPPCTASAAMRARAGLSAWRATMTEPRGAITL
jgi:hypothetical protein